MLDLTKLMSVIEYADNHQVKNVRYHLNLKAFKTDISGAAMYGWMQLWARDVGLATVGAFTHKRSPSIVQGMVIATKKRKCNVFVYFDF